MVDVLILVDEESEGLSGVALSSWLDLGIRSLKQAIVHSLPHLPFSVERVEVVIGCNGVTRDAALSHQVIICALTLNLPSEWESPLARVYNRCQQVASLRQHVETLGYSTGVGHVWLPIVLTAKGPLYGEAIGKIAALTPDAPVSELESEYYQPLHLLDRDRQWLYRLGYRLLRSLDAPAATYLLQVGMDHERIWFDRLFPFPATPAIASIGIQTPDLFMCHWRCLTAQPILDLVISPPSSWGVYEAGTLTKLDRS